MRQKIQYFIDKIIFKGSHEEVAEENERLRKEITRSERMKTVATLASGMAHEIKNPLTTIKTFTEHLPRRLKEPGFLDKYSRLVGQEVDRINDLVHQLLEFAKPTPPRKEPTDIHTLIGDTLDFFNNQFVTHKIKVEKAYAAGVPPLQVDRNQIRQVLLNLFLNAVEAMSAGGLLKVETRVGKDYRDKGFKDLNPPSTPKILKSSNASPVFLEIRITDTGPGIAQKDMPRIFDPFFSKKDNGTGLGLSISHEIIRQHGGQMTVESQVGKGTAFGIQLPILKSSA